MEPGSPHVDLPEQHHRDEGGQESGQPWAREIRSADRQGRYQDDVAERQDDELLVPLAQVLGRLLVLFDRYPAQPGCGVARRSREVVDRQRDGPERPSPRVRQQPPDDPEDAGDQEPEQEARRPPLGLMPVLVQHAHQHQTP